jgi:cytoskeleton protein RodZ
MDQGVGARLREARSRSKVDLDQVEVATKIRGRYLRAIEDEEWDLLPGDSYARAFVRAYADHLGLDGDRMAEELRRERGMPRPGERLVRGEPMQLRVARRRRRLPSVPSRLLAVVVSAILIGVLVAIGLSADDSGEPSPGIDDNPRRTAEREPGTSVSSAPAPQQRPGLRLSLTATAEVWVCLLDGKGEPLVDGIILPTGAEEGPYRSGSFTVSLGNGEVDMTVDGEQASIPETSSPIGFEVGSDGSMRQLSEAERPSCT